MRGSGWSRRRILAAGTLGAVGAVIPGCVRSVSTPPPLPPLPSSTGSPAADAIVASTALPSIPAAVFPIYGLRGDGRSDDTRAIQDAIDTCHARGGGRVVVPAPDGSFMESLSASAGSVPITVVARDRAGNETTQKVTVVAQQVAPTTASATLTVSSVIGNGAVRIFVGVIDAVAVRIAGAVLAEIAEVLIFPCVRQSIAVIIVGRGVAPAHRIVAGRLCTAMVETVGCARVLIQGVTLVGSPFWQIHPTLCADVTVEGVTTTDSGPNSDGCDPESCERVVIRGCTFSCGDDNVALKSGRDEDGRRLAVPCRNVVIVGCQAEGRFGFITCGSEQSGGIENVFACANRSFGRGVGHALWVKSNSRRGGYTRNVNMDGFRGRVLDAVATVTMHYDGQSGAFPPSFDGIHLRNLAVESAGAVLHLDGLEGSRIRNFTLSQSRFVDVGTADRVRNADVVRSDVTINGVAL